MDNVYNFAAETRRGESENLNQKQPNYLIEFFLDGVVGYGSSKTKYDGKETSSKDEFKIGVRPGLSVAVSDNISFVSTIGWLGYSNIKDQYNTFGLNLNNALKFGLYYSF